MILHPDGPVIVAYIPEAESYEKPLYIKSKGIKRGAFRRIGPTDQLCTREDLDLINRLRSQKKFDETTIGSGAWKTSIERLLMQSANIAKEVNRNAKELEWSDKELMLALGAAEQLKTECLLRNIRLNADSRNRTSTLSNRSRFSVTASTNSAIPANRIKRKKIDEVLYNLA